MDVWDALRTRLTVRQFKPDPVPERVVTRLLQAALWAPSSRNRQPWRLIVIRDRDILRKLGGLAPNGAFLAEAPLAIAIGMDSSAADKPQLDSGRALQQMEILAWAEGLGTCFVTFFKPEQFRDAKELLQMPDDVELITILPFGYRHDHVKGVRRQRKPLSEIAFSERYGNPYAADEGGG